MNNRHRMKVMTLERTEMDVARVEPKHGRDGDGDGDRDGDEDGDGDGDSDSDSDEDGDGDGEYHEVGDGCRAHDPFVK